MFSRLFVIASVLLSFQAAALPNDPEHYRIGRQDKIFPKTYLISLLDNGDYARFQEEFMYYDKTGYISEDILIALFERVATVPKVGLVEFLHSHRKLSNRMIQLAQAMKFAQEKGLHSVYGEFIKLTTPPSRMPTVYALASVGVVALFVTSLAAIMVYKPKLLIGADKRK